MEGEEEGSVPPNPLLLAPCQEKRSSKKKKKKKKNYGWGTAILGRQFKPR
jgi:hypothetical protein